MNEKRINQVFIHIGLHKTGTTFLQEEIFKKIKEFHYVYYFNYLTPLPSDKSIIISNEELNGRPHYFDKIEIRYTIADQLHKLFPDAKIIIGLRKKESLIESLWKQHIIEGGTIKYKDFINRVDKRFFDYNSYVDYLKSLFPDVYIYWFHDLQKNKQKIINDLCCFMGVTEPDWEDKQYRISLSIKQSNTLRVINKCIPISLRGMFKRIVKQIIGSWRGVKKIPT